MEYRTFIAVVLLGLLATASSEPLQHSVYESLEAQPMDKQLAEIGSLFYTLAQPAFSNILAALTTNMESAVINAFAATVAGKTLGLIKMDSLAPFKESAGSVTAAHLDIPGAGGERPQRRPNTRSMGSVDVQSPQGSHPQTGGSSESESMP